MKQTAIKLAILTSFVLLGSTVNAQPSSNYQVYGNMDLGMQYSNSGGDSQYKMQSNNLFPSRIGLRGTEHLSNDLYAKFTLEAGINPDDGSTSANNFFSREAFIGLGSHKMGEVRLGNNKSPFRKSLEAIDPFYGNQAQTAYLGGNNMLTDRTKNSIIYISPNYKGLKGELLYGFGEQVNKTSENSTVGLNLSYAYNDLNLYLGYNQQDNLNIDTTDTLLGATYDFKKFQLHGAVGTKKIDHMNTQKTYSIGARVPIEKNQKILASYTVHDYNIGNDSTAQQIALGYTYGLSPKTSLYGIVSHNINDTNTSLNSTVLGKNSNIVTVGINHIF